MASPLMHTDLASCLKLIARGKVREIYEIDADTLLFVATDRISAYDVILENAIPSKGALLTALSVHWFQFLRSEFPPIRTHFLSISIPPSLHQRLSDSQLSQLEHRSMLVQRFEIFPIESIVRGYITGSAWSEYSQKGTVHTIKIPEGLRESERLNQPLWTPSTKAAVGDKDENIHPETARKLIGEKHAKTIENLSVRIYEKAHAYALERGIIIADTKFEFGLDRASDEVVLVDEILTPDSSRFWPAKSYEVGKSQQSFDKQYLRDWLTSNGLRAKKGVTMPDEIVNMTRKKYVEAFEMLTGRTFENASQK